MTWLSDIRARGVAGLTRLPVTEEIAGSNPVGPAKLKTSPPGGVFILDEFQLVIRNRGSFIRVSRAGVYSEDGARMAHIRSVLPCVLIFNRI